MGRFGGALPVQVRQQCHTVRSGRAGERELSELLVVHSQHVRGEVEYLRAGERAGKRQVVAGCVAKAGHSPTHVVDTLGGYRARHPGGADGDADIAGLLVHAQGGSQFVAGASGNLCAVGDGADDLTGLCDVWQRDCGTEVLLGEFGEEDAVAGGVVAGTGGIAVVRGEVLPTAQVSGEVVVRQAD